jgi:hypothetical protein
MSMTRPRRRHQARKASWLSLASAVRAEGRTRSIEKVFHPAITGWGLSSQIVVTKGETT